MTIALALASRLGVSGSEFLNSYIAAPECTVRLGAMVKGGFQQRRFHPTGAVGTFGATIAAGWAGATGITAAALARGDPLLRH